MDDYVWYLIYVSAAIAFLLIVLGGYYYWKSTRLPRGRELYKVDIPSPNLRLSAIYFAPPTQINFAPPAVPKLSHPSRKQTQRGRDSTLRRHDSSLGTRSEDV
jgi:hypothetical protein